jgi:predicted small lipoprotein YifL
MLNHPSGDTVQARLLQLNAGFAVSTATLVVAIFVMFALSGCASPNPTQLPDLQQPAADGMLKPDQQQKAIDDLARKKAEEQAKAVRQIERQR